MNQPMFLFFVVLLLSVAWLEVFRLVALIYAQNLAD
jgi:hypothetical protein